MPTSFTITSRGKHSLILHISLLLISSRSYRCCLTIFCRTAAGKTTENFSYQLKHFQYHVYITVRNIRLTIHSFPKMFDVRCSWMCLLISPSSFCHRIWFHLVSGFCYSWNVVYDQKSDYLIVGWSCLVNTGRSGSWWRFYGQIVELSKLTLNLYTILQGHKGIYK